MMLHAPWPLIEQRTQTAFISMKFLQRMAVGIAQTAWNRWLCGLPTPELNGSTTGVSANV
jgi:hypothetical protein